jgi:hypothetical protein
MNAHTEIILDLIEPVKRKKATRQDRATPCECCGYPVSHRHHPFGVNVQKERGTVLHLCPNCHELYHVVERVFLEQGGKKTEVVFDALMQYEKLRYRAVWCLAFIDQVHGTSYYGLFMEMIGEAE